MRKFSLLLSFFASAASASAQWQPVADPIPLGTSTYAAHLDAIDSQTAWFANTFYFFAAIHHPVFTHDRWRTELAKCKPGSTHYRPFNAGRTGSI
jgi:hypothetical protein